MVGSGGTLLPHHDIADGVPDAPEPLADLGRTSRVITRGRAVTPTSDWREERRGTRPGPRYVRVLRSQERAFTEVTPSHLVAGASVDAPRTGTGRLVTGIKRALIGRPIASEHAIHERLTKVKALAVLSSDALSSVAYATEQTLIILVLAGAAALRYTLPISIAIVTLLAIVAISYRQTIYAYPNGGGSYIVAKDNLGTLPGLIAAASLLIDYVLTVSVSVSAGVLAIISAFPSAAAYTVPIGVLFILLLMLGNLRGVRESGTIFAIPTYIFVIGILTMIAVGLGRVLMGDPAATSTPRDALHATEGIGLFLVLRAFTSGCTALTGVEAISNGIPAFKKPESKNAATTLIVMVTLLGTMFLGISILAHRYGILPRDNESVVSQIAAQVFGGKGVPYFIIQIATTLILVLAANTSYADFPRLGSILARDGFLPRQFQFRGDRLAFTIGIVALTILSAALYIVFGGQTDQLIPLYAVGVFISFTLSQAGMVRHWLREPGDHRRNMLINGVGAIATGIVAVLFAYTKFLYGAWLVIIIIPLIVLGCLGIAHHYRQAAEQTRLRDDDVPPTVRTAEQVIIVPVADINKVTLNALVYARALSARVVAVHVTDDAEEARHLQEKWEKWGEGVNLVILESPYRSLTGPLLSYIDLVQRKRPEAMLTVLVPEYVPDHWWEQPLHSQTALRLKAALLFRANTVVTSVPYRGSSAAVPQ